MAVFENVKWWAFKSEWERRQGTKEAELTKVALLNQHGERSQRFKKGEDVTVKAEFVVHEEIKEPHFGVALFREDGLYCYGPNTAVDGYKIERLNRGQGWFSIEYKNINLSPDEYRISVAIWDKKEILAHCYHPGFYKMEIVGPRANGELVDLAHLWMPWQPKDALAVFYPSGDVLLKFLEDKWKKEYNPRAFKHICVEFVSENADAKDVLKTNERAEIKIDLDQKHSTQGHYLWVGIFRKDAVYCHGMWRKLGDRAQYISLIYPKLPFLPGEYRVSLGIWSAQENTFLASYHGMYPFHVVSDKKEHGTVYMAHQWRWVLP